MKSSEFIESYTLHDSLVEDILYDKEEKHLKLTLELCQWKQPNYIETEPEMQLGILKFTEVVFYEIQPDNYSLDSNEILEVELVASDSKEERIKIILNGEEDVVVLIVEAAEVSWNKL
ncbi:hypothetical protein [Paenibacillus terrae]|uniref:Uncharacterized protein n=1 Tax=Paenibacillus terrae TaxID=159743 RepID=A0A0D7XAC6_9BACL|nr:hypothetical protein [Paenibacillus terrae]KJD47127.1 hypothetical protein QD47_02945 [Paenibacillus terrae]